MPLQLKDGRILFTEDGFLQDTKLKTNHAPSMSNLLNKTVKVGQKLSFTVKAWDTDGDPLKWTIKNLPAGASFKNYTFSWIPSKKQTGTFRVTFRVSDGELTNSRTVQIVVKR